MWATRSADGAVVPVHTGELVSFSSLWNLAVDEIDPSGAQLPGLGQQTLRPRGVLLVFFPFAFSPTCHEEVTTLSGQRVLLEESGIRPVAVSCDPKFTLAAWATDAGIEIPLLSDFWPHGALSREFGVFDDNRGMAVRGTFLLDAAAQVIDSEIVPAGGKRDMSAVGLERWMTALG